MRSRWPGPGSVGHEKRGPAWEALARRPAAIQGLVLLALVVIVVVRSPQIFVDLRLFGEEVTYFSFAYHQPWWKALLSPLLGYYSLLPSLAAVLGAHVLPLEFAPVPNIVLGVGCILLMAWLVMLPGSPFGSTRSRLLAIALLILIPPSQGRFDLIYGQYYLCIATALILLSESPSPASRWIRRITLGVAGLTGLLAVALTPLYWLKAWRERSPERLVQTIILSACCLLQAGIVLSGAGPDGRMASSQRSFGLGADVLMASIAVKSAVFPLFGWSAMHSAGSVMAQIIQERPYPWEYSVLIPMCGAVALGLLWLMIDRRKGARPLLTRPGNLLAVSYLMIVGLGFALGLSFLGSRVDYLTSQHRYFSAPNAFLALALVLHAARGSDFKARLSVFLSLWMLAAGLYMFVVQPRTEMLEGPGWRQEVAQWRKNPEYPITVWPATWGRLLLTPEEADTPR